MNPKSQNTSTLDSDRELRKIVGALSKITSRSPEEIEPQLEALIDRLNQAKENDLVDYLFYVTSTCEQWSAEFHQWYR